MRSSAEQIESWLVKNGYRQNFFVRYGQWLGVCPEAARSSIRRPARRCRASPSATSRRSRPIRGILQGDFGCSTKFKTTVSAKLFPALGATGMLMFWVMVDHGADLAADRHSGRHAGRHAHRPNAVGRLDHHDGHARICVGRHLHGDFRLVARLAQRLGRQRHRARASPSTISRCR